MRPSHPLRLGLVGCGRLAEVGYLPAIVRTPGVLLAAVADPDRRRAGHIVDLAGADADADVEMHGDLGAMLAAGSVDAVVLATPAASHVEDAASAVAAGLPVLVEKPPAPDAAGAARLVALGPGVRVGFNRRFDAGARAVRSAVPDAGQIVVDVAIRYRRASWNPHTVRDDVLLDLAPHLVDWVRWLAGQEILDVRAVELNPDHARLELTTTRGGATVTASADHFHAESLTVTNSAGSVVARHRTGGLVAAVTGRLPRRNASHPLADSLAAQLAAFADAVRGEAAPDLGTTTDGLAVMTVIDAARTSAVDGHPVDVPDSLERPPC